MCAKLNLSELNAGMVIPEIRKTIVQEDVNLYAKASLDFNPIHIDEEFAKKTALGGTIAHGMLILAYISQLMTDSFGLLWLTCGRLNVRFKAPARPGDIISIQGKIRKISNENGQKIVNCEVLCSNQKDEVVITGEAIVRIKVNQDSLDKN
jgi:3-hydroxybutyryl-CoA dehydratase